MKYKILLFACLLIINFVSAQNFGAAGTQWYYGRTATAPPNSEYEHYQSIKDTVIAGITTHKINCNYYQYNGGTASSSPVYMYQGNDTVFMYSFERNRFLKFCIFNALQGDTLILDVLHELRGSEDTTYTVVINSVESIMINNAALKKYKSTIINGNSIFTAQYFTDRIGWLGQFYPEYMASIPTSGEIRCFSDDQIDTNFTSIACDYRITSLNNFNTSQNFTVFPNPVHNKLYEPNAVGHYYEILNMLGQKVLFGSYVDEIDCSQLKSGLYTLVVYGEFVYRSGFVKN